MSLSKSDLVTFSPLTRASTSGSCSGTGLIGSPTGGGVACPAVVDGVADFLSSAAGLRQAETAVTRTSAATALQRTFSIDLLWPENMEVTDLRRFAALQEGLLHGPWATWRRQLAGVAVDVHEHDPFGDFEGRVRLAGHRPHHEGRPDRERRLCAAHPDRLIVVEAHPYHREQVRSEADE